MLLWKAGYVNGKGIWTGGRRVLLVSDVPDRGPHSAQAMAYFTRLSVEATEEGGAVEWLRGDHEEGFSSLSYGEYGDGKEVGRTVWVTVNGQGATLRSLLRLPGSDLKALGWVKDPQQLLEAVAERNPGSRRFWRRSGPCAAPPG